MFCRGCGYSRNGLRLLLMFAIYPLEIIGFCRVFHQISSAFPQDFLGQEGAGKLPCDSFRLKYGYGQDDAFVVSWG